MIEDRYSQWYLVSDAADIPCREDSYESDYLHSVMLSRLADEQFSRLEKPVSNSTVNAWRSTLDSIADQIETCEFSEQIAIFEAVLKTRQRIDVAFCGKDYRGEDHVALLEFKRWKSLGSKNKYLLHYQNDRSGIIAVTFRDETRYERNPLNQISEYRTAASKALEGTGITIPMSAYVVLPECSHLTANWRKVLISSASANIQCDPRLEELSRQIPVITRRNKNLLLDQLSEKIGYGTGYDAVSKFINALDNAELPDLRQAEYEDDNDSYFAF